MNPAQSHSDWFANLTEAQLAGVLWYSVASVCSSLSVGIKSNLLARTSLVPLKCVPDMGGSTHAGLNIAQGQRKQNGYDLGLYFISLIK